VTTSTPPSAPVGTDDDTQAVDVVGTADEHTDATGTPAARHAVSGRAADVAPTPGTVDATVAASAGAAEAVTQRPITPAVRRTGKVRKARLRLLRVEPWSVMKSAFILSIAVGITFVVAIATLWSVIDAAGVFDVVGGIITEFTQSPDASGVDVNDYVGFTRVVGLATVIAVVNVVLLTALATLFAFLYNLSAALLGGFELTLAEDD
jgi:hypothetical protein